MPIPLIVAGISAVTGLGQAIYSGVKASKERKNASKIQQQQLAENKAQQAENESWYNSEYYKDFMQRSDNQNVIKKLREMTDKQNRRTEGLAAITGATKDSVLAQKEATNRMIADTHGNIAGATAEQKDRIMQYYLGRKNSLYESRANALNNVFNSHISNAQANEKGIQNGLSTMGSAIGTAASYTGNGASTPAAGGVLPDYTPPAAGPVDPLNNYMA